MIRVEKQVNGTFLDISDTVSQDFNIQDSIDKSLDSVEITIINNSSDVVPPKTIFRINDRWIFRAGDTSNSITRYEDGLYTHKVMLIEILKDLENIQCTNYAITLDKRIYYLTRSGGVSHITFNNTNPTPATHAQNTWVQHTLSPDISKSITLFSGDALDITVTSDGYIRFENNGSPYRLSLPPAGLDYARNANQSYAPASGADVNYYTVNANTTPPFFQIQPSPAINNYSEVRMVLRYYKDNALVIEEIKTLSLMDNTKHIISSPDAENFRRTISSSDIVYTRTDIDFDYLTAQTYIWADMMRVERQAFPGQPPNIPSYRLLSAESTFYNLIMNVENYVSDQSSIFNTTLDELIDKVLRDVNAENLTQYRLSPEARGVLSGIETPELTLEGYNLKELIFKIFSIANAYPVIAYYDSDIFNIDIVRYNSIGIDTSFRTILNFISESNSQDTEYTYDKGISDVSHLVDEQSMHTETVYVNAEADTYDQITDAAFGFQTSYPIYYLRDAVLKGFSINATVNNTTTTHTEINITDYVLEYDEYKAIPDISMSTDDARKNSIHAPNPDINKPFMSKGNTIQYTSGERFMRSCGHMAPSVPAFWTVSVQQLALIEVAVRAIYDYYYAQGYSADDISVSVPSWNVAAIYNLSMDVIYTPMLNTRITFYNENKKQFRADRMMNYSDKVVSHRDLERSIRENQDKMGNVVEQYSVLAKELNDLFDVGHYDSEGYIITNRSIACKKNMIICDYTMQKDFAALNEEVALDIQFSRYWIPYEYLTRHITKNVYMLVGTDIGDFPTGGDVIPTITEIRVLVQSLFDREYSFYQTVQFDGIYLMNKMVALYARKSVTIIGSMIDNYSAGSYSIYTPEADSQVEVLVSIPLRYCNELGKAYTVTTRMGLLGSSYDLKQYPTLSDINAIPRVMITNTRAIDKDAREKIEFIYNFMFVALKDNIILNDMFMQDEEQDTYTLARYKKTSFGSINPSLDFEQLVVFTQGQVVRTIYGGVANTTPLALITYTFPDMSAGIGDITAPENINLGLLLTNRSKIKMFIPLASNTTATLTVAAKEKN